MVHRFQNNWVRLSQLLRVLQYLRFRLILLVYEIRSSTSSVNEECFWFTRDRNSVHSWYLQRFVSSARIKKTLLTFQVRKNLADELQTLSIELQLWNRWTKPTKPEVGRVHLIIDIEDYLPLSLVSMIFVSHMIGVFYSKCPHHQEKMQQSLKMAKNERPNSFKVEKLGQCITNTI